MLDDEMIRFNAIDSEYAKYWVPIRWSMALIYQARNAEMIASDAVMNYICDVCFENGVKK